MVLILFFALNISFVGAVWHLSTNHLLGMMGQEMTGGVLRIPRVSGFLLSEYWLVLTLFLMDILFVISFYHKQNKKEDLQNRH